MAGLLVDPPALDRAGAGLAGQGGALASAVGSLASALGGSGQMCGNDKAGQAFALSYRRGGQGLFATGEAAVNACRNLGYGIGVSAANYARSEAASHVGGAQPSVSPPAEPTPFSAPVMPDPFGPAIGEPALWSLVNEFIGSPWPDGNPATLHTAAGAWRAMGASVSAAVGPVASVSAVVAAQQMPEAGAIVGKLTEMVAALGDFTTACQSMAATLDSFAEEVSAAQEAIRDILHRLSISGILEELGSIFTGHDPWEDVRQVAEDIKVILHTMQREADGAEAMFQAMMGALDSATTQFEDWARREFTHFLGEDVGTAVADFFEFQIDVDEGVFKSLLMSVDGLQQLATNPRQWEAMATMADPATQITEFAKDPKAYLAEKVEMAKGLVDYKELTGDHPGRGVGVVGGNLAQMLVPGLGEAKAATAAERLAAETGQVGRTEGALGRAGEALGAASRADITSQTTKLTNEFTKASELKAPIKALDAIPPVKEPGLPTADPGKGPAGAAGPPGAQRAPVEVGAKGAEPPGIGKGSPVPTETSAPRTPGAPAERAPAGQVDSSGTGQGHPTPEPSAGAPPSQGPNPDSAPAQHSAAHGGHDATNDHSPSQPNGTGENHNDFRVGEYDPDAPAFATELNTAFVNGQPTEALARTVAELSTHHAPGVMADRLVLGRWDGFDGGYIGEAVKNGGIYFDTGGETWEAITQGLGESERKQLAWQVNEEVLRLQLEDGVDRIDYMLDHKRYDSLEDMVDNQPESYSAMEVNFLTKHAAEYGYERFGNSWIRSKEGGPF